MDENQLLPILNVTPSQLAPRALMVGDPDRAAKAAALLTDPQEIGFNREYRSFTGRYRGVPITVCSHGVGGSGASVCFTELFQGGVKTLIRAGTCGALQVEIDDGQLVLATGAIREDGTSPNLIPMAYPAIADCHIVQALRTAAADQGIRSLHTGVVLTQSYLYPGLLPTTTDLWMKAGAVAVEMELATLLVMAGLQGVRAGGILTSDGNLARRANSDLDTGAYDPHREVVAQGVASMLTVALEALASLA